ncbi:MAG: dephospho-CoA kinase [Chlamydiia bacterium]|nr:dephospho-CoA kinase [Chlamydiia bacterium]
MLKLKKVAVTGGLSSGKSTVCQFFQQMGASVISADEIVHNLLNQDPNVQTRVLDLLGRKILEKGSLNRKAIAEKVFHNPDKLEQLEKILYPKVQKEIEKAYEMELRKGKSNLFIAEIPLLYEAGMATWFDDVIVVEADQKIRQTRFSGSSEDFNLRSKRQMSLEDKVKNADYILHNNGSQEELKQSVKILFTQLNKS